MTEQFANATSSTLNGAITNGATSLIVTSATGFPATGTYRVIVDSELMIVTARSGTTLTVTRGAEGTTAASHLTLAAVTCIVTAGAIAQLKADLATVAPTGTGVPHVVGGVQDAAASLIVNADVHASAAIAASKVVQATGTGIPHVVSGSLSAASSLIVNADVDAAAAIAGTKILAATSGAPGAMSAADKAKLDGIQAQGVVTAVSAMSIDWALGGVYTKTLAAGGNTFTFANAASGMSIIVRVTGAASTLTWPTVLWAGGVAPTQTASGKDVYTFVHDGTSIYGSVVQAMA